MNRFYAVLQVVLAVALYVAAFAIGAFMVRVAFGPEPISVISTIVGLIVVLGCTLALATTMAKKGLAHLRHLKDNKSNSSIRLNDSQL